MGILRSMGILLLIILIIAIGSKAIYEDTYTTVSGEITLEKTSYGLRGELNNIAYPTGFTKDNCVIISQMLSGTINSQGNIDKWSSGFAEDAATSYALGGMKMSVSLLENSIKIIVKYDYEGPATQKRKFKIKLMKD